MEQRDLGAQVKVASQVDNVVRKVFDMLFFTEKEN